MWPPQERAEWRRTSLAPLATLCAMHPRVLLAFLAIRDTLLAHGQLLANRWSTRKPLAFLAIKAHCWLMANHLSTIDQLLVNRWSTLDKPEHPSSAGRAGACVFLQLVLLRLPPILSPFWSLCSFAAAAHSWEHQRST